MLPGGIPPRLAEMEPWVWGEDRAIPFERLIEGVADAEAVLSMLTDRIDGSLIDRAPHLRVVSQMAVGVDNIDLATCAARGIVVGHTPDVLTETTADTAFALAAAAIRRIPEGIEHVRSGLWGEWRPDLLLGGDLHRATLGIVGLGRIGRAIARRGSGFEMRVLYTGRSRHPEAEATLHVAFHSLQSLLEESDIVVVCAALTADTQYLISEPELRRMRADSCLVNVGRGGLVDPDALVVALREGWIARAALDVTEPEPIPADHPLVGLSNCLVVPHIGSASVRTRQRMADLAVDNLLAGLAGRPLPAQMRAV